VVVRWQLGQFPEIGRMTGVTWFVSRKWFDMHTRCDMELQSLCGQMTDKCEDPIVSLQTAQGIGWFVDKSDALLFR
jgi:hypothetical protein